MSEKPKFKVENRFAWVPVFIRNKGLWGCDRKWVWFRRYTRILKWKEHLGRYRTIETVLGWHAEEIKNHPYNEGAF